MLSLISSLNICTLLLLIGDFGRLMDGCNTHVHIWTIMQEDWLFDYIKRRAKTSSVDLLLFTVDFNIVIVILPFKKHSDCCLFRDRMLFLFDLVVIWELSRSRGGACHSKIAGLSPVAFSTFPFVSLSYQQKCKFIPYNINYIGNNNS